MKVYNILKYIFTITGAILCFIAFSFYNSTSTFKSNSIKTLGSITGVDSHISKSSRKSSGSSSSSTKKTKMYTPIVTFDDNKGNSHTIISSSSSSSYPNLNEEVDVYYNPNNPEDAKLGTFMNLWGGAVIFSFLGGISLFFGILFFVITIRKQKKNKDLKQNGYPIEADFQNVSLNQSVSMNGKCPYNIISQWQDPQTSKLYIFESDDIWFDPTNYIQNNKVKVLIDKNNPKKYMVDLSFLPKLV